MVVEFEMTDLGELHYFLGIEVWQKEDSIFMSQTKYTWDIVIVSLYVDDFIYIGNNDELLEKFKSHMIAQFDITHDCSI